MTIFLRITGDRDGAPSGEGREPIANESGPDGVAPTSNHGAGVASVSAPQTGDEEPDLIVSDDNHADSVAKLDLQLHWLWKVHGVDYYAGIELNDQDWPYRLNFCRLIRGSKPEEGEADDAAEKADKERLGRMVDECWKNRIVHGDPIEAKCLKSRVGEVLRLPLQACIHVWMYLIYSGTMSEFRLLHS